jgi:hypothetical protein
MKAPSVSAKTLPETVVLPARRLVAAPVNCDEREALEEVLWTVGVASSEDVDDLTNELADVILLVDDGVTTGVDSGSEVGVGVEAGAEPSVGVSDCRVVTASTNAEVADS